MISPAERPVALARANACAKILATVVAKGRHVSEQR